MVHLPEALDSNEATGYISGLANAFAQENRRFNPLDTTEFFARNSKWSLNGDQTNPDHVKARLVVLSDVHIAQLKAARGVEKLTQVFAVVMGGVEAEITEEPRDPVLQRRKHALVLASYLLRNAASDASLYPNIYSQRGDVESEILEERIFPTNAQESVNLGLLVMREVCRDAKKQVMHDTSERPISLGKINAIGSPEDHKRAQDRLRIRFQLLKERQIQ